MKKYKMFFLTVLIACILGGFLGQNYLHAWDGFDYGNSEYVEIESGNLVRDGEDIEVYHWGDGAYHQEEVQGMQGNELETYDYDTGEYRYYDMD